MSYDHYKCLAINKNILRCLRKQKEYAFLANFRNWFLIFATPHEIPRMLTNIYECLAITLRSWRSLCDHCELMANGIRKPILHTFAKTFIFAAYSPEMIRLPRRMTEKVRPFKWLRMLPNFLRIPANFLRSLRSVCRISG